MKLTLQLQLFPDDDAAPKLRSTVERFNEAADWLAGEVFAARSANKVELQRKHYRELRDRFGLSAQMAVRCIAQACEAYKRDKAKRPKFRKHAAMPFDQRMMSFKGVDRVSLLTLQGRVIVPFVMGKYQRERFRHAKGQCDLIRRKDGKWFLLVTVDLPEGTPTPSTDFLGVDLGVENLATDSDGQSHSGQGIDAKRERFAERRRTLDKAAAGCKRRGKRPKNIRRAKRRQERKEARYRRDINHQISKRLVAKAKDTDRGIALEDLTGIRDRTRFRKPQRARIRGWAFFQLRTFVQYKATLAGVPVVLIDPRNTSRTCRECGHCEKANRKSQADFECRSCGHRAHADLNAARNLALRARASVMVPMVAEPHETCSPA